MVIIARVLRWQPTKKYAKNNWFHFLCQWIGDFWVRKKRGFPNSRNDESSRVKSKTWLWKHIIEHFTCRKLRHSHCYRVQCWILSRLLTVLRSSEVNKSFIDYVETNGCNCVLFTLLPSYISFDVSDNSMKFLPMYQNGFAKVHWTLPQPLTLSKQWTENTLIHFHLVDFSIVFHLIYPTMWNGKWCISIQRDNKQ